MADDVSSTASIPDELPLLVFRAAGAPMAALTSQVDGIIGPDEAARGGVTVEPLGKMLGATRGPAQRFSKVLLLPGRNGTVGVGIDGLEEVCTVRADAIQQLPGLFLHLRGPRHFWGVMVRRNEVVLLLDLSGVKRSIGKTRHGRMESEDEAT